MWFLFILTSVCQMLVAAEGVAVPINARLHSASHFLVGLKGAARSFESLIGLGYFAGPLVGGTISEYAPNAPYMCGLSLSLSVFFIQIAIRGRGTTS